MTLQIPPPGELELTDPDDFTFGEVFAIKAATGIDVLTAPGTEQGAALLWFALKQRDPKVTWGQILDVHPKEVAKHMDALVARITREQSESAELRAERDNVAAVAEQARALGEEVPTEPDRKSTRLN